MSDRYRQTLTAEAERYYTCSRCGARGEVAFEAVGQSSWHEDRLLGPDPITSAHEAAEHDLLMDASQVLALMRCPSCGLRGKGSVRSAALRVAAFPAAGIALLLLSQELLVVALVLAFVGCWQLTREVSRLLRANRARVLLLITKPKPRPKLEAPPPKKPNEPPPRFAPDIPVARALAVPAPPPPKQPRGPGEEPAFLNKPD